MSMLLQHSKQLFASYQSHPIKNERRCFYFLHRHFSAAIQLRRGCRGTQETAQAAVARSRTHSRTGQNVRTENGGVRLQVGFEMVDAIAEAEGMALSSVSFKALVGRGFIGDAPVIFAKPQTYMNKSGWSHCLILQNSIAASTCEFDLENGKSVLDEQGLRIAENQENSQKNRRKLAESTRDFKKASPEENLNIFNSLLKGYQEEVDNLTKRAKFGENAFLNIYQKLYEAPDPYLALADASANVAGSITTSERQCFQYAEIT